MTEKTIEFDDFSHARCVVTGDAENGGVATVTMNRPEVKNALSGEMVKELTELFQTRLLEFSEIPVKAVILTGAGGAFCAGGDISAMKERRGRTAVENRERMLTSHFMLKQLANFPMPVIAAVDGPAAGAGANLALACDIVLASTRSLFMQAFARIGLVPDYGGMFILPRVVGIQRAKELIFSARPVRAEEALSLGLCMALHEPDDLMPAAYEMADRFRYAHTEAIGIAKNILNQTFSTSLDTHLDLEAHAQSVARTSAYHDDCIGRFLEKKPLKFDWARMDKEAAAKKAAE